MKTTTKTTTTTTTGYVIKLKQWPLTVWVLLVCALVLIITLYCWFSYNLRSTQNIIKRNGNSICMWVREKNKIRQIEYKYCMSGFITVLNIFIGILLNISLILLTFY